MIRKKLAATEGQRKTFSAVFSRFGKKVNYKGYSEETVLLTGVTDLDTNEVVTDHIWFTLTRGFEKINLKEGIRIQFDARVKEYTKGYVNKRLGIQQRKRDYKLSHPTKIALVKV